MSVIAVTANELQNRTNLLARGSVSEGCDLLAGEFFFDDSLCFAFKVQFPGGSLPIVDSPVANNGSFARRLYSFWPVFFGPRTILTGNDSACQSPCDSHRTEHTAARLRHDALVFTLYSFC